MVPNLILNSFRRTIMPKGSFFPPPTKTPATTGQPRRLGKQGRGHYSKSMIAMSVMRVSVTAHAALTPGPNWRLQQQSPPMTTSESRQSQCPPRS